MADKSIIRKKPIIGRREDLLIPPNLYLAKHKYIITKKNIQKLILSLPAI